jgi:GWxTD domain-containing protein
MQPILGSFKIPALPSGNYYLNINLLDRDNVIVASKSLFFQRYNNKPKEEVSVASAKADTTFQPVTVLDLHKTFVMKYTLPELKAILKMILPVASPIEAQSIRSFLKNPDEGYMRYFIYNHFSSINKKAPEAAWKDFTERIKEINKKFGTSSDPGYETDRGRIYLKYGKPDEELTEESERGALPYEIWQYNNINEQYKNAVFLFYRPSNMLSGFQLLHSTVNVEVRNPNWRSVLFANHSDSGDPDSKAERYLGKR